jgi:hypothetical protein
LRVMPRRRTSRHMVERLISTPVRVARAAINSSCVASGRARKSSPRTRCSASATRLETPLAWGSGSTEPVSRARRRTRFTVARPTPNRSAS